MGQNLIVKAETMKTVEENIGIITCDLGLSNDFLDMRPKTQETKEKTGKFTLTKVLHFKGHY